MPTFEEHRRKCDIAKSTQLTLQTASSTEYADWIVITAFYQALHWVDAFFALDNYHPGGHGRRRNAVYRHADLGPIRDSYTRLYDASIYARYGTETFKDVPDEVEALFEEDLVLIVTHINELIDLSQV